MRLCAARIPTAAIDGGGSRNLKAGCFLPWDVATLEGWQTSGRQRYRVAEISRRDRCQSEDRLLTLELHSAEGLRFSPTSRVAAAPSGRRRETVIG
jgi:hypothetical protein